MRKKSVFYTIKFVSFVRNTYICAIRINEE